MELLFIHLGINAGFGSIAPMPLRLVSRSVSPSNLFDGWMPARIYEMNDIVDVDVVAGGAHTATNTEKKASQNKKESMPTQIKSESERIKSIISRKFEWESPLIAEF